MRKKTFDLTDIADRVGDHRTPGSEAGHDLPQDTTIEFRVLDYTRRADFARWYGCGIDEITAACQRQILRFVNKQDAELEGSTISTYCDRLPAFLDYCALVSTALGADLGPSDINRTLIDGFISSLEDGHSSLTTQRGRYMSTKAVLKALCARGIVSEVVGGDDATFPANPFPHTHKQGGRERPLTKSERDAFARAVKAEVAPLLLAGTQPTGDLLAYALLIIALHTGRNTTPLLELSRDCLRPHPKANTQFLVLFKRRGHATQAVAVKSCPVDRREVPESLPSVRPTVARLINVALALSESLRDEAPAHLKDRVWLYRSQVRLASSRIKPGQVIALTDAALARAAQRLIAKHQLIDSDGKPLRINVRRLRKTFVNRMFEILEGDVVATAAAAGHSVAVSNINYLAPDETSERNWKFMGSALVQELLTGKIGATERTPVGQCSDTLGGDYAPKRDGATCMSFLNCFRCRNYVVTGDDLYRLFSFYWRVLKERARMDSRRWQRQLAHIVRLIDRDVIAQGIASGVFSPQVVEREKSRARNDPHPFWRSDSIMSDLASLPQ